MSQHYSNPDEDDPYALPDVEVFYKSAEEFAQAEPGTWMAELTLTCDDSDCASLEGWYWWPCSPGCLPDSDPVGPFDTESEALADARR